jgi:hypothetical protein
MSDRSSSPTKTRLQSKLNQQKTTKITVVEQQALFNKLKNNISAKYVYKIGTILPSRAPKDKQYNKSVDIAQANQINMHLTIKIYICSLKAL